MRLLDITGQRFGRLTVLRRDRPQRIVINPKGYAYWRCRCDCGRETVVCGQNLLRATVRSCGCLRREAAAARMRARAALRNAEGTPVPAPGQASCGTGLASPQETGPSGS